MASGGTLTEVASRKVLSDILESTGQAPLEALPLRKYLAEWLESKEATTAKATARRYKDVVGQFLVSLGDRAGMQLSGLTGRDVRVFRDQQLKVGKSNKTANMAVKTLRVALGSAQRQGLILSNPAASVDMMPDNSATRETFKPDQLKALLEVADQEWRGMILLGACTGLRIQDAARLLWSSVDLNRKVISYYPQKTANSGKRKPLEAPMLPDMEKYLLDLPIKSNKPEAPLFPTLSKKKANGRSGLSNTFFRLISQAGIDNEAASGKTHGKGRTVFKLGFHSLRHTFVSFMANMGVPEELRKKIVGHTSNVHERYTHLELKTLQTALENFPRLTPDSKVT